MKTSEKAQKLLKALVTRTLDIEYSGMPCSLKNISNAKILNLVKSTINCSRKQPLPPVYPIQLHVEISSLCSLKCPLCPGGLGLTNQNKGNMTFNTFQSLIDEVGDYVIYALLWGWGEPCLNRKLPEMISYAHSKNVATIISTNGQQIQTLDEAEALVSTGLDCVIISLDGASQDTYSQYRSGGEIKKVFRCMDNLNKAKEKLGSVTPVVNVQAVIMKHNEHELPEIEKISRKYGADMMTRMSSHIPDYAGEEADNRFAPEDPQHRRFEYRNGKRVRRSINDYRCIRPWDRLTVTWDGTVIACEHDFNSSLPFGRGGSGSSFLDAWRGQTASEFRKQFLTEKSAFAFCADCHYRDSYNDCLIDKIFLKNSK